MRKNFKMAVISIVLLITGGILLSCGKKEEKTTEVTTEEITAETSTELLEGDAVVTVDSYSFSLPEGFVFKGQDDNMYAYMKGDTTLSFFTENITNNYDDITSDYLYAQMKKYWTPEGSTELDYSSAEKDGIKKCMYTIGIKANNETYIQCVTCYVNSKDNRAINIVFFDKVTSEKDADKIIDTVYKFDKEFEDNNF